MTLKLTTTWDKVFPPSPQVATQKVTFHNHFGIELAADLAPPAGKAVTSPGGYGPVWRGEGTSQWPVCADYGRAGVCDLGV